MRSTLAIALGFVATLAFIAFFCFRGGPWWVVIVLAIFAGIEAAPLTLAIYDKIRGQKPKSQ